MPAYYLLSKVPDNTVDNGEDMRHTLPARFILSAQQRYFGKILTSEIILLD